VLACLVSGRLHSYLCARPSPAFLLPATSRAPHPRHSSTQTPSPAACPPAFSPRSSLPPTHLPAGPLPHIEPMSTSTRPSLAVVPPASRTLPTMLDPAALQALRGHTVEALRMCLGVSHAWTGRAAVLGG